MASSKTVNDLLNKLEIDPEFAKKFETKPKEAMKEFAQGWKIPINKQIYIIILSALIAILIFSLIMVGLLTFYEGQGGEQWWALITAIVGALIGLLAPSPTESQFI